MAAGWIVGVLVELRGEPAPLRHYYAIGHEDRGKAEWTAVDHALRLGGVATSPHEGQEPVQAISPLTPQMTSRQGLRAGEVRALGPLWPRRWVVAGSEIAKR